MKYLGLIPLRKEGSSSVWAFMCTPVPLGTVWGWLLMIWTFPGRVGVSFLSSCWTGLNNTARKTQNCRRQHLVICLAQHFFFSYRYSQDLSEQPAEKFHVWGSSPPSFPGGVRGIAGTDGQRSWDVGKRGRAEAWQEVPCEALLHMEEVGSKSSYCSKKGHQACVRKGNGK